MHYDAHEKLRPRPGSSGLPYLMGAPARQKIDDPASGPSFAGRATVALNNISPDYSYLTQQNPPWASTVLLYRQADSMMRITH